MDRRDVHLSLVQGLLAAPGSTEGWKRFLMELCDALHGSSAKFIDHRLDADAAVSANVSVMVRTDPHAVHDYQTLWYPHDEWRNAMSADVKPGTVLVGDALIPRSSIRRTAFYNDFARRYDTTQLLAGMLELSPRRISNISVNRSDSGTRFDGDDAALLAALMPHIDRAMKLHRRLAGAELMSARADAVLERLPYAVILVSEAGALLATNRVGDMILRRKDGLVYERGVLRGATPTATSRLHAVIRTAIATATGNELNGHTGVMLPRPSGRRDLSILVAPLPARRIAFADDAAAAAIFIADPDRFPTPDAGTISRLFGLTRGEAAVVQQLVAGHNLQQAATALHLKLHSVRTTLKIVFEKTGTHRQAELVRLVLSSAAVIE